MGSSYPTTTKQLNHEGYGLLPCSCTVSLVLWSGACPRPCPHLPHRPHHLCGHHLRSCHPDLSSWSYYHHPHSCHPGWQGSGPQGCSCRGSHCQCSQCAEPVMLHFSLIICCYLFTPEIMRLLLVHVE